MKPQGTVKPSGKKAEKAEKREPVSALGIQPLAVGNYREQERKRYRKEIIVCEIDDTGTPGENIACDALDLSKTGIGFRSRKLIASGRAVVVIATTAAGNAHAFFGVVRHSSFGEGARYHTGVEFREMPGSGPIRLWLRQNGLSE